MQVGSDRNCTAAPQVCTTWPGLGSWFETIVPLGQCILGVGTVSRLGEQVV